MDSNNKITGVPTTQSEIVNGAPLTSNNGAFPNSNNGAGPVGNSGSVASGFTGASAGSVPNSQVPNSTQNQDVSTVKDVTKSLIVNWLIWYCILSVVYMVICNFISAAVESQIIQVVVFAVLQTCMVFTAWIMSTKFTFKEKLLRQGDLSTVMRNLAIFSMVICMANAIYQFVQLNNTFSQVIESNYELNIKEKMLEQIYDNQEMQEYYQQKSKVIAEAKRQSYTYLVIFEVSLVVIFLAALPVEKKLIMKHIVAEGEANQA